MSASYCGQIRRRSNLGSGRDLTFSQGDHAGMSVEMMTKMITRMITRMINNSGDSDERCDEKGVYVIFRILSVSKPYLSPISLFSKSGTTTSAPS